MNETLWKIKSAMAAFFMALGAMLGWKGAMLLIWVGCMALDYLSGTLAACREGKWSSAAARQGLWHKGGMILVVTVGGICDGVFLMLTRHLPLGLDWPGLVLPLVTAWYILTELGSMLENAVAMGAAVPAWLIRLLKAGADLSGRLGDSAADALK